MKKILLIVFLLFLFVRTPIFAADKVATDPSQLEPTPTQGPVNYEMPYPGVLPDNPLYILKAIRDRVVSQLINDPIKKAEFSILTSDKRMMAGILLIQKNNDAIGMSTITKGNNYFHQALSDIKKAKGNGREVKPFLEKMKASAQKHEEVLTGLKSQIDKQYKKELDAEIAKNHVFEEDVKFLLKD